jgi:hypothetical protein
MTCREWSQTTHVSDGAFLLTIHSLHLPITLTLLRHRIGNRKNVFIREADTQHDLKRTVAKCRTGNNWYSMALWSFNARNGCNIWTRYTEWAAWLRTRAISWRRTGSLWTLVKNFQEWILLSHVNKWSCESYKFWSSEVTHLPSDSHLSDTVLDLFRLSKKIALRPKMLFFHWPQFLGVRGWPGWTVATPIYVTGSFQDGISQDHIFYYIANVKLGFKFQIQCMIFNEKCNFADWH